MSFCTRNFRRVNIYKDHFGDGKETGEFAAYTDDVPGSWNVTYVTAVIILYMKCTFTSMIATILHSSYDNG